MLPYYSINMSAVLRCVCSSACAVNLNKSVIKGIFEMFFLQFSFLLLSSYHRCIVWFYLLNLNNHAQYHFWYTDFLSPFHILFNFFFDIVRFIRKFTNIPCALRCALLTCSPSSKPIILLECSQLNNDDVFAMRIWSPLLQYGLVGLSVWFGHTGTIFDCKFSLRLIPQRFILSLNCEIYEFKQKTV